MATVQEQRDTGIFTSEAVDLIDCFSSGFDEILSDLATNLAKQRAVPGGPVEITEQDIIESAKMILNAVKESDLPTSTKAEVAQMFDCVATKSSNT